MRRASSFLAEHDVATFNLANNPPPVANAGLGSYSRALEFTSMALSSSETNNMKLMCRRFSADAFTIARRTTIKFYKGKFIARPLLCAQLGNLWTK